MAGHSLLRLKSSLVNTPHLIEQSSFDTIMDYLERRIDGSVEVLPKMWDDDDEHVEKKGYKPYYNEDNKIGTLDIDGPLTYRTTGWEMLCGGTSYQQLKSDMEYFVRVGAKTVVMYANSGGGEAFAVFDSANYIRKLATENGIKLIAFVDGRAASACYALVSVADEIVVSTDSQVGSIGVLIQLVNDSKHMEQEGYERVFVTAGASKIPFAKDGSFRPEFLEKLQSEINECYESFTSHVALHRNISQESVKATEAEVYGAKEALKLGLIDKTMTIEDFHTYVSEIAQGDKEVKTSVNPFNKLFNSDKDTTDMVELQALQAQLEAKDAELAATLEALTTLQTTVEQLQLTMEANEALLVAAQEVAANAQAAQAELKVTQRKAALAAVLSADQLETQYEALASLDDAAFDTIVSQYASLKSAQAASFEAVGAGAEGADLGDDEDAGEDNSKLSLIDLAKQTAAARWGKK